MLGSVMGLGGAVAFFLPASNIPVSVLLKVGNKIVEEIEDNCRKEITALLLCVYILFAW